MMTDVWRRLSEGVHIEGPGGGLSLFGGGGLPPRGSGGSYVGFSGDDFRGAREALQAPLLSACVLTTADLLAQLAVERREIETLDMMRTFRAALFGLLVKGPIMGTFYPWTDRTFPSKKLPHIISKLLVDQGPYSWFLNSCFLFWVPMAEGCGVHEACETVTRGIIPLQLKAYKMWPVVHTINYTFVPPEGRIMFVASANVIWSVVCCLTAAQKQKCEPSL